MALTLVFQQPNDGKIDCAAGIIRCMACGGKPPYKWSTTAGTLDKTTGQNVKLSAPVNVKPSVAGNAYIIVSKYCTFGDFTDCICETYGCNGQVTVACNGVGCGTYLPASCDGCITGESGPCVLFTDGTATPPGCAGLPVFSVCAGLLALHFTTDLRTQQMKDDGCGPCFSTMLNAVVTVTDAQGNSVSRSIKT